MVNFTNCIHTNNRNLYATPSKIHMSDMVIVVLMIIFGSEGGGRTGYTNTADHIGLILRLS